MSDKVEIKFPTKCFGEKLIFSIPEMPENFDEERRIAKLGGHLIKYKVPESFRNFDKLLF